MEIFEEEDEEIKQLMLRISRKEITLCETCDAFFDYIPQKRFCDECIKKREREYHQRPEVKEQRREYLREYSPRPENKERRREYMREYNQRPEVKEKRREYQQRPEVKERRRKQQRERRKRKKKLREEG